MTEAATQAEVLIRVEGSLGRLTLNRPRAINALNHAMVQQISAALRQWLGDDQVRTVVLDGAGERGLCAGGDIRAIHSDAVSGGTGSLDFWRDEYRLNAQIANYSKPFVAIMDGLVMGGGVGLSAHASHRVVTERSVVGMPEVGIGLIPDVGGTYLLSRAPGFTGLHVALTNEKLNAADAIYLRMADREIRSEDIEKFIAAVDSAGPDKALDDHGIASDPSPLAEKSGWINAHYAHSTVERVLESLRTGTETETLAAALAIESASPSCVKATFRAIGEAKVMPDLETALNAEFRAVSAALRSFDLAEGIRAQVIDKDRRPAWRPSQLSAVLPVDVDKYFAPVPDLPFPDRV